MNRFAAAVLAAALAAPAFAMPGAGGAGIPPRSVKGTVKEALAAGTYTYLLIKTEKGEEWTAVQKTALKKGDKAEVLESAVMENFDSPVLKRRFDKVVFGVLAGTAEAAMPAGHGPMGKAGAPPALPKADVKRPAGPAVTVTIAELYKKRKELASKLVRVKGKVVKANANILGRNWFHIVDGTGSKKAADNDLTLTTTGTSAVDSYVWAEGVAASDKDLGSGYSYTVILEDAELSPVK
ncbi:MAG: nucleotide-binding protein [Elusimicrobia bacterium]|nr:nucleotide-binding protein [Elusimicrobiota bacterium]